MGYKYNQAPEEEYREKVKREMKRRWDVIACRVVGGIIGWMIGWVIVNLLQR